ncbi:GTPase ObgE [Mesomycoplasma hyorhinis]|uniref:GTPase ObgE n=1 Tax=Mesomycoplasma hyorhinis TaxID=2100 RepID=UPI001C05EB9D|nr:GTPase ObgE [Mesomycoplasma hyorhinis]
MKFIDQVKIKIAAGKGGDGVISFRREAHVDRGGPDGGDGGDGGSIFFVGDSGLNTLLSLHNEQIIKGNDGENGKSKNRYGAKGEDIFVKIPLGTLVFDDKKLICDVVEEKPYLVAKGGRGGRGNTKFKSSKNKAPRISENGDLGQSFNLTLNLKVLADVGFVGKPSAGKSTVLEAISNAKPKIADYEFTTLVPQLGLVKYYDKSFVAADLPGLIAGASLGKGLGFVFLKHIERCKAIAHIIDFGSEDKNPISDFELINNELFKFNEKLKNVQQVIVANKNDLPSFNKHLTEFKKIYPKLKVVEISALEKHNIHLLKQELLKVVENAQEQVYESTIKEVEIKLNPPFKIEILPGNVFNIFGDEIKKIFLKIPLNSHDNLLRFNNKLKYLGVWQELINKNIKTGDTVRVYDYVFVWNENI